jgi:hypothetical protein
MTDKEKSYKLIETLRKLNKALDLIEEVTDLESAKMMVNDIQETIAFVLDAAIKAQQQATK